PGADPGRTHADRRAPHRPGVGAAPAAAAPVVPAAAPVLGPPAGEELRARGPAVGARAPAAAARRAVRRAVVPGDAAHAGAAVGRGRRAAELPQHLDVCDRRGPL